MTDPRERAAHEEARKRQLEQKIQRQLDEALEDSFPASDPVSIVTSHAEEDWGSEPASAPPEPASPKSAPPADAPDSTKSPDADPLTGR